MYVYIYILYTMYYHRYGRKNVYSGSKVLCVLQGEYQEEERLQQHNTYQIILIMLQKIKLSSHHMDAPYEHKGKGRESL